MIVRPCSLTALEELLTKLDIILSLTRTSRVGYLRDVRRLTVALSRARLGLYILGRREIFESCFELRQAFDILLQRPDKLMLVTGELFSSSRVLNDEEGAIVPGETPMESVEHLGQYVYEMTNSKVQQIRAERGLPVTELIAPAEDGDVELGVIEEETGEDGEF
jgi:intron-binding protein aquarius